MVRDAILQLQNSTYNLARFVQADASARAEDSSIGAEGWRWHRGRVSYRGTRRRGASSSCDLASGINLSSATYEGRSLSSQLCRTPAVYLTTVPRTQSSCVGMGKGVWLGVCAPRSSVQVDITSKVHSTCQAKPWQELDLRGVPERQHYLDLPTIDLPTRPPFAPMLPSLEQGQGPGPPSKDRGIFRWEAAAVCQMEFDLASERSETFRRVDGRWSPRDQSERRGVLWQAGLAGLQCPIQDDLHRVWSESDATDRRSRAAERPEMCIKWSRGGEAAADWPFVTYVAGCRWT